MNKKIKTKRKVLIKALIAIFVVFIGIIFFIPMPMNGNISLLTRLINALSGVTNDGFTYEVYGYSEDTEKYNILLSYENPEGISKIYDRQKDNTINGNGKNKISIDYVVEDYTNYLFDITLADGTVKNETFSFERTRYGKDTYKNVKGVYANTPNLEGYIPEFTRYLQYTADGVLQPANWITDEEPTNWYDYNAKDSENNQSPKWANIYVENEGVEDYLVWIPRYCYKMPESNESGNERVDIKFIDVYNNYNSPEEGVLTWAELKALGYKIPEAFEFGKYKECSLSGFWISKYELSDLTQFKIDYNLTASSTDFEITDLTKNTDAEVAKYTFAINGQVQDYQPTEIEDFTFVNGTPDANNTINVTALDSDGRIVGSMTKKVELVDCNAPNLMGFDPNTTFYVYYDSDGNEHNEIPISQDPPEGWYNYTYRQWANIVTKNDGLENYLVWIPRYQYRLNTTNQRVSIKFIKGTGTETQSGYQIPEAFTWQNGTETKELEGYWISKYELSN